MSLDSLRKKLLEQKENGTLNAGYTAPELQFINQNSADTYTPPEVVVPTAQPKTTPISTNTQTPKNTQLNSPVSKPTNNTAKNTTIPSSAKNSSQAPADPKSGAAGAKTMKEIQTSKPSVYIKKNKFLAEAYSAGFYGMDITRETRDSARAGGYLDQIEAMYKAGKQDSKGNPSTDKSEKSDNGLNTEAAREEKFSQMQNTAQAAAKAKSVSENVSTEASQHEKLMRALNIKQAQKLAHTSDDSDDNYFDSIGIESHRRNQFLQKKIDNQGKSGYNSDGISITVGSDLIDFDEVGKGGYELSDVEFFNNKTGKNVQCVIYANNRAREYWGIEGGFEINSGVEAVRKGKAAPFLTIVPGKDMQNLLNMPSHSLAFFGPTYGAHPNPAGHEVFIEGKDDNYIYFSESNYGDAPTNGKVQRITYEDFLKRGGGFIGYAAIDMTKYKK